MNFLASSAARASFSGLFSRGRCRGFLENLGHVFLSILDAEHFGKSLELVLEVAIGGKSEIVLVGFGWLENGWRALRRRWLERRLWSLRGELVVLRLRWRRRLPTGWTLTDRRLEDGLRPERHEVLLGLLARHPSAI